jgi:hypothetical protein
LGGKTLEIGNVHLRLGRFVFVQIIETFPQRLDPRIAQPREAR